MRGDVESGSLVSNQESLQIWIWLDDIQEQLNLAGAELGLHRRGDFDPS
jgi:hypothetical protein